jgi:hypothetical protein
MSFYTVRMKRKQIISKYDARGRKISEIETLVDQVYHDLPHQTALSYQTQFPDAQVTIERQAQEFRSDPKIRAAGERESKVPRAERTKIGGHGTAIKGAEAARKKVKKVAPAPSPALGGGDMTDALNKALERA